MAALYAFFDESGDPNFPVDEPDRSAHYVVGGVLVPEDRTAEARSAADAVRREHFGPGEMTFKSRAMSKARNAAKRRAVVEAVADLPVTFAVVGVDKRAVRPGSPLERYKRTFTKFTGRVLFERLYASHEALHVVHDEHGSEEYMEGFNDYVNSRAMPDLFRARSTFCFEDSEAEPLVQAADIVVGTVFRLLRDPSAAEYRRLFELLRPRLHVYATWPMVYAPVEPPPSESERAEADRVVRDHALSQAARYLDEHRADDDPVSIASVAVLDRLVYASQFDPDTNSVHAAELVHALKGFGFPFDINDRWLRAEVIGPLRDDGVVIAGSHNGYVIPRTMDELDDHARQVRTIAVPMIKRLARYRADLFNRTGGDLDLVGSGDMDEVRALVDALGDPRTPRGAGDDDGDSPHI